MEQILADMEPLRREMMEAEPEMDALFDPARRAAAARKLLPPMRRMLPLVDELAALTPDARPTMMRTKFELRALMAILGDADSLTALKKSALSNSRDESVGAKAWLAAYAWAMAAKDAPAQEQVIKDFTDLAKANVEHDVLVQAAALMMEHPATPVLGVRAENVILQTLKSPEATAVSEDIQRRRKLRALEGKPLVIEGTASDGQPFSTERWKGKVVMVDFWATWCPPCMFELRDIKNTYTDFHPKGLEIVGVSSDRDPQNFRAFLQDNKDMPWPQIIDPTLGPTDVHPLLKQYGIEAIPTIFLIDKKGVCRSVTARGNYREQIQKLIAE